MKIKKRGISPVIATMLLIIIVIVIALIVFLWLRGLNEEAITKFDGENVKLVCNDVHFDASYDGVYLYIQNTGNVPIYQMKAKKSQGGSYTTDAISTNWPENGINPGGAYSGEFYAGEANDLLLIPVLIGNSKNGEMTHTCDETYGYQILI